jgi:ornithine cyclodeaminase
MQPAFAVITGETVHKIINSDYRKIVEITKEAYMAHGTGNTVNPNSYFLRFPEKPNARIIALPAYLGNGFNVAGIKWVASYPDNVQAGLPRASALLILNSYETGYPFACLEGSIISAARTAASAVLSAEWLNHSKQVRNVGFVGNGFIARYVYRFFVGNGWEMPNVYLYDVNRMYAEKFRSIIQADRHQSIAVCDHIQDLITSCDLTVFTTTATTPHISDMSLFLHNPIVLHISLRDLAAEILLQADNIVDDVDHVMNANTSPHLAEQMSGRRDFVNGTLYELMTGKCQLSGTKPRIFSPFGLGVLDLAVGKYVYDVVTKQNEYSSISGFFCFE